MRILTLEPIGTGRWRGPAPTGGTGRPFGGRLLGQAVAAAGLASPDDRAPHSLHGYFMRPGLESEPIDYGVETAREGRSFIHLRIVAEQGDKVLAEMTVSLATPDPGLEHRADPPDVPPPEALTSEADYWRERRDELPPRVWGQLMRARSFDIRPVAHRTLAPVEPRPPVRSLWFRAAAPLPDDPALHRALLAYASDMTLLGVIHLPHGISHLTHAMTMASLDHALWLHAPDVRVDDWLLYHQDSPWTGDSRGLARGQIYDRAGRLVASVAQEGMLRLKPEADGA